MRVTPSSARNRYAMTAGVVAAAGALLAGCSEDGSTPGLDDVESAAESAAGDAQEQGEEAVDQATENGGEAVDEATDGSGSDSGGGEDESWWDTFLSWFESDDSGGDSAGEETADEPSGDEPSDAASGEGGEAAEPTAEESAAEDSGGGEDESWWDTFLSWFDGEDESESGSTNAADEESGGQDAESEAPPEYGFPATCAEAGAAEVAANLVPVGSLVQEDSGEVPEMADSQYLICTWEAGEERFTVIYTRNADPNGLVDLAGGGGESMNWEVDLDVDVENYRSSEADALGGELDYSEAQQGDTQIMHLSLPENLYVSAVSVGQQAEQQDLEAVVYQAAERIA